MNRVLAGAAFGAGILVVASHWLLASDDTMPDPTLTPGSIASVRLSRPSYGTESEYRWYAAAMWRYGIPRASWRLYELDHRIPLCLDGSNDLTNLWPQPKAEAARKDDLEIKLCREVDDGAIALHDAQAVFFGDWREAE